MHFWPSHSCLPIRHCLYVTNGSQETQDATVCVKTLETPKVVSGDVVLHQLCQNWGIFLNWRWSNG